MFTVLMNSLMDKMQHISKTVISQAVRKPTRRQQLNKFWFLRYGLCEVCRTMRNRKIGMIWWQKIHINYRSNLYRNIAWPGDRAGRQVVVREVGGEWPGQWRTRHFVDGGWTDGRGEWTAGRRQCPSCNSSAARDVGGVDGVYVVEVGQQPPASSRCVAKGSAATTTTRTASVEYHWITLSAIVVH